MEAMEPMRKTIAVCFESVIGKVQIVRGEVVCPVEEPTAGIRDALQDLMEDHRVVVCSRYCMYPGGQDALRTYLNFWKVPFDAIMGERPVNTPYIDRWAIPFDGRAERLPDLVRKDSSHTSPRPPVAGMRRCVGTQAGLTAHETVEGWFHCWMETSTVQGTCTVALLETEDGRMVQCPVWTVRFLDHQG